MLSSMKKSIGWFVFTLGAFCFFRGNLNSMNALQIKTVSEGRTLDVKPQQTLQQPMNSMNTRQEIST